MKTNADSEDMEKKKEEERSPWKREKGDQKD